MHSTKNVPPISENSPNVLKKWILAARPKTWIAAIAPVCIGASLFPIQSYVLLAITLLFALAIQIGTNFANDAFDFMKGADTHTRIGPKRAVQQGWITPASMLFATKLTLSIAFVLAIPLMIQAFWWSFFVVFFAILCAVFYTAGPKPLGYLGLGEILVFIFFGPVATCGTSYLQIGDIHPSALLASIAPGMFSVALIVANNLRDEATDRPAHKNTLVVRFGALFGKIEYTLAMGLPFAIPCLLIVFYNGSWNLLSAAWLLPVAIQFIKKGWRAKKGEDYAFLLGGTALVFICYTILFCWGAMI